MSVAVISYQKYVHVCTIYVFFALPRIGKAIGLKLWLLEATFIWQMVCTTVQHVQEIEKGLFF